MKRSVLFMAILAILFACSPEKMNFSQLQDRNGLLYIANKTTPYSGQVAAYQNGKVEFEGTVEKGLREGLWTYYYPSGQKRSEGMYKEGMKDGTWTSWQENGVVEGTEMYKYGQLIGSQGTAVSQDTTAKEEPQAEVKKETKKEVKQEAKPAPEKPKPVSWEQLRGGAVKFLDGVPYTGPVVKYFKNGNLELEGSFNNGHRSGKWTFYNPNGSLKYIKYY